MLHSLFSLSRTRGKSLLLRAIIVAVAAAVKAAAAAVAAVAAAVTVSAICGTTVSLNFVVLQNQHKAKRIGRSSPSLRWH
jgi:hypothetical protein